MLKDFLKKLSKEKCFTKSISLIIALTLVFTSVSGNIAYAMPMAPAIPVVNSIPTNQFVVPFNIGRITDALYNGKSEEIIINIQDLHSHEQTQRNISSILNILDRNYGIDKIYVEGAIGKVDTSWISKIADKNVKEKVVNNLLKSGRLTGSELYAIESGKEGILEGIEDKEIYLKNVDRLNEIYNKKSEIEQYLPKIKYVLEESVKKYYSKENIRINRVVKKNKDGKISADKYFRYIVRVARNAGIDINRYSRIKKFMGVIVSQKSLKTELVNKEVGEILEGIKRKVTFAEYKKLTQKINNKEQETEFYNEIKKISEKEGLLKRYPNATKFFNYIQMNEGINPVELVKEEKNIIKEIQDRNSKTVYEKEAYFLSRYIDLIESYLSNKMTADEYTYFVNNKDRFELLWKKYVDIDGIIDIQKYFNLFEEFYKDNVERNRIFVEKITGKKVAKEEEGIRIKGRPDNKEKIVEEINRGKKIKVVITGGFHTYGFTKLLEDNGIDYCVITPNITEETLTAEKLYENVFKEQYKLQNQTFQKMLVSQVIGLLNKGEIASVTAQGENVLINYANNNGTINLNKIREQPETETDKMVSKADAEKIAKIFAKTFFTEKAKLKEEREQARKAALGVLQDKGIKEKDAFLVLSETLPSIKNKKTRAILAAVTETLLHPIYTFFDSEEFAAAHYDFERGELEKLKTGTDEEKEEIYNKYFGLKERLEGARSIKKTGWISFAATGIISLVITAIIFLINPLSAQAIIIGIVIDVSVAIVAGYIGAMVRHIVYNIKVLKSNLEGSDKYLLVLPEDLEKLDKEIKEINEVGIDIRAEDYKKEVEKLIDLLIKFHSRKDVKGVDYWDKQAADIFRKQVLEYVEQQRAVLMSDNKKAGLKIGDNFFPMNGAILSGSLPEDEFKEKLGIVQLSEILKDKEKYLAKAKFINFLNMQLNGGAGSSVKRDRWLKCLQLLNNKLERKIITDDQYQEELKTLNFLDVSDEEIKDIKVNLGAKAADMYFRINVGTAEKPKYELKSITDVKLNELLEEIKQKKYASVSVVMLTSAPSVNLIEKSYKSGGKNIKEDINRKDGRFIKEIFGDKDVAELAMMLCGQYPPVYMGGKEKNIFKFRLDKEAPSGHGVWLKTISEKTQKTAKNFIICIANSDAVNSGTPAELVGYMVENQKGIMVIAATREAIDRKGGIIGLKKIILEDSSVIYVPAIMEIAQARAIGEEEEKLFQAMGFDKYEGQVAFNTNTVLINVEKMKALMECLQGLINNKVISQEEYDRMALPDLIKNKKGDKGKEYYQLEGALVSGVFNLNEKIEVLRKKDKAKELDTFMEKNFPTGLIGITLASKEQRTQIFTPFKFAPDFWIQYVNGNINKETWLWEPKAENKGGATNVSTPRGCMYDDVYSLLRYWRDCDIKELNNLYINPNIGDESKNKTSVIKMKNVVLKGDVTINNDTDQELLIKPELLKICGFKTARDGKIILENVRIDVSKKKNEINLKITRKGKEQIYSAKLISNKEFNRNDVYIVPVEELSNINNKKIKDISGLKEYFREMKIYIQGLGYGNLNEIFTKIKKTEEYNKMHENYKIKDEKIDIDKKIREVKDAETLYDFMNYYSKLCNMVSEYINILEKEYISQKDNKMKEEIMKKLEKFDVISVNLEKFLSKSNVFYMNFDNAGKISAIPKSKYKVDNTITDEDESDEDIKIEKEGGNFEDSAFINKINIKNINKIEDINDKDKINNIRYNYNFLSNFSNGDIASILEQKEKLGLKRVEFKYTLNGKKTTSVLKNGILTINLSKNLSDIFKNKEFNKNRKLSEAIVRNEYFKHISEFVINENKTKERKENFERTINKNKKGLIKKIYNDKSISLNIFPNISKYIKEISDEEYIKKNNKAIYVKNILKKCTYKEDDNEKNLSNTENYLKNLKNFYETLKKEKNMNNGMQKVEYLTRNLIKVLESSIEILNTLSGSGKNNPEKESKNLSKLLNEYQNIAALAMEKDIEYLNIMETLQEMEASGKNDIEKLKFICGIKNKVSQYKFSNGKKTLLITGGLGYIGGHNVKKALECGYNVVIFSHNRADYNQKVLYDLKKYVKAVSKNGDIGELRCVFGDLMDKKSIQKAFDIYKIDGVEHFAAWSEVNESVNDPVKYLTNNYIGTQNLLDVMVSKEVKVMTFASSAATYGDPKVLPLSEEHQGIYDVTNTYGWTKLGMEKLLQDYSENKGMFIDRFRFFNVFGSDKDGIVGERHVPESHLLPIFAIRALTFKEGSVNGTDYPTRDGSAVRDYVDVMDLANAHILALDDLFMRMKNNKDKNYTKYYNIGGGDGTSVIEMGNAVAEQKDNFVFFPAARRPGDPATLIATFYEIKEDLGWKTEISLEESVSNALKFLEKLNEERFYLPSISAEDARSYREFLREKAKEKEQTEVKNIKAEKDFADNLKKIGGEVTIDINYEQKEKYYEFKGNTVSFYINENNFDSVIKKIGLVLYHSIQNEKSKEGKNQTNKIAINFNCKDIENVSHSSQYNYQTLIYLYKYIDYFYDGKGATDISVDIKTNNTTKVKLTEGVIKQMGQDLLGKENEKGKISKISLNNKTEAVKDKDKSKEEERNDLNMKIQYNILKDLNNKIYKSTDKYAYLTDFVKHNFSFGVENILSIIDKYVEYYDYEARAKAEEAKAEKDKAKANEYRVKANEYRAKAKNYKENINFLIRLSNTISDVFDENKKKRNNAINSKILPAKITGLSDLKDCDIMELRKLCINSGIDDKSKNKTSAISMRKVVLKGDVTIDNSTAQELLIEPRFLHNCGFTEKDSDGRTIIEDAKIEAFKKDDKIMLRVTKADKTQTYDTLFIFDEHNKKYISPTKTVQQSFVKKIIQWLKIGWDNIVSIFSKKATIMAIVDINDVQAIEEAKDAAEKGVKVELVFIGKQEEIMNVLQKNLIPTEENKIVGENKKELFYELQNTIENLTTKIYESVEDGKLATAKDTINNVIKQLDGANKNVVYVSKHLVKDDSIEQQLDKAKSNNKLLAYSTKSIKSAMVRGIITLKNKAKALSDMKVKKENIMAILKIGEVKTFVQELNVLRDKGIKTIMLEMTTIVDRQKLEEIKKVLKDKDMTVFYKIQIKQKNDTENVKMLTRGLWGSGNIVIDLENYSEAENDVKNVIKQFGYIGTKNDFRYKLSKKIKSGNKSVVLNYNEAIEMINKKEGIFDEKTDEKAIVMIKETDGENMVINTSNIQKLIDANVSLAFDAEIINAIDSQDTSKNGITMLEIIKSMFTQTKEAKFERLKAKGKIKGREFALKKIEEFTKYHTTEDILEKEEEICSVINNSNKDVIKYVKDLTDNKTVKTKEDAKFILTGILEVIELIKLTNEPVEDLRDDISDNANKLLEMLGQYRLLEGKSYVKDAGKEIVEKYQDKSFAEILDTLEQNLKQENAISNNKAAVLEGIIYLLLSSRLDIREEKKEMMEINIQSISKMLAAA